MNDKAIWSYPKVYNLGVPEVEHLFGDPVDAQEKVDGSQFSFALFPEGDGRLVMRSKGAIIYDDALGEQPGVVTQFRAAVDSVKRMIELGRLDPSGRVYRCEFLSRPKHNTLAYDRVPTNHLILFDVEISEGVFGSRNLLEDAAAWLGIEPVTDLGFGRVWAPELIRETLTRTSQLGGQSLEGIVFKNYDRAGPWTPVLFGKHVSEAFKETHRGDWRDRNPNRGDILERLTAGLRTPARWEKAIQHLRDAGELTGTPRDIGPLIAELQRDVREEEGAAVAKALVEYAMPKILRGVVAGFAEFYKARLLEAQFETREGSE